MVNINEQRRRIYLPNKFEQWLLKYGVNNSREAFDAYYGGIQNAIVKKKYFDNTMSFPKYKQVIATEEDKKREELLNRTQVFLENNDINALFVDAKQQISNKFDVFKVFDEVRQYDMLFIKNIDLYWQKFFVSFGIEECVDFIYFFPNSNDSKDIKEKYIYPKHTEQSKGRCGEIRDFDILYREHHMIGFELYDNLKEWKKEVTASTRKSPEYKKMKKRVRQRDGNTCQCCGYHSDKKTHHHLEVHHIYGYKDHLDYRTEDSNCITLCSDCHKKYHSLYGKKNVTPFTFVQFIKEYHDYYGTDFQTTFDTLGVK